MTVPGHDPFGDTPAVVVDRKRLVDNITAMQSLADRHGLALRPHIKTHKSIRIARMQMEAGAVGVTASKPDEAMVFMAPGIGSVTVAYPLLDPRKVNALCGLAATLGIDLQLIVDSSEGLAALSAGLHDSETVPGVFIKIDVGLHRCGLKEEDPLIGFLARRIADHPRLRFSGLISHAGHAYGAVDADSAASVAEAERLLMLRVSDRLKELGIPVPRLSVGATPTVLAARRFDGITEIRPGNYVFLDRTPIRMGLAAQDAVALTVVATVVSKNADFSIIDAGSKTLSSDMGPHGGGGGDGFGIGQPIDRFGAPDGWFAVNRLSEEHGWISRAACDLPLGSRVRIIPNHACPVANLARTYRMVDGDASDICPVDAAGKVG
ncbi:MAG: alanine racemase [Desulfobacterales bacterium]|jgi:D-serine deaminase-like pyridoxal phosphate-dependent protein